RACPADRRGSIRIAGICHEENGFFRSILECIQCCEEMPIESHDAIGSQGSGFSSCHYHNPISVLLPTVLLRLPARRRPAVDAWSRTAGSSVRRLCPRITVAR